MKINEFKSKLETILNKHFFIKDIGNGSYEIIEDNNKDAINLVIVSDSEELSIKVNNKIIQVNQFLSNIALLADDSTSNEEIRKIYVDYLGADSKLKDSNYHSRVELVNENRYINILINDEDWDVRKIIAKHGRDKDLDILVSDESCSVRGEVARYGRDKDLNILVNDKSLDVRHLVNKLYNKRKRS